MNRYSRQILIPWIGEKGQKILGEKRVLVVGLGALGSVIANHMVRAGIGHIHIIDRDFVELDNLQRQILYDENDAEVCKPKALAAKEKLERINSEVNIESKVADLTVKNIETFLDGIDLVIDGTDNFETRFLLNDACFKHQIDWIYGACVGSTGMTMNFFPPDGPCLQCLLTEIPPPGALPTCDTAGILSSVPQIVGSVQANEALKILLNDAHISRKFLYLDLIDMEFKPFSVKKSHQCPVCDQGVYEYLQGKKASTTITVCGRNMVQITPKQKDQISLDELGKRLKKIGKVSYAGYLLKFIKGEHELIIFPDGRTFVKGTTDAVLARSLYSKYVGY